MFIYIFGSGGLARCCWDVFKAQNVASIVVCKDGSKPEFNADYVEESEVANTPLKGIVAVGDNFKRHALLQTLAKKLPQIEFVNAIHPSVVVGQEVIIGVGTYIGAGSILGPGVGIGSHCVINARVTVEHECQIGDFVNIGTGCSLGGNVTAGHRSILGVNATVNHGQVIGEDALVASGACVVKAVEPGTVVMGVPAKETSKRKFGDSFL